MLENPYKSPDAEGVVRSPSIKRTLHLVLAVLAATALSAVGGCSAGAVIGMVVLSNLPRGSVLCGNEIIDPALTIGLLIGAAAGPFIAYLRWR